MKRIQEFNWRQVFSELFVVGEYGILLSKHPCLSEQFANREET